MVNGMEAEEDSLVPIPSGADITIRCRYTGVPIPNQVEWTQDGALIQDSVVTEEGVSTLTVRGVVSGGVYQCHVTNQYGRDTASIYVCPAEQGGRGFIIVGIINMTLCCFTELLPGEVPFIAVPNTNNSLYITWEIPSIASTHPLLLRYEVKVQHEDSGSLVTYFPPTGVMSFIAFDLIPGELYRVSVVAVSLLGRGDVPRDILMRTFGNRKFTNL